MKKNIVLERLKSNQRVLGCIIQGNLPSLVEMAGLAGFHFVFIDVEHYSFSMQDCENLVRAAETKGICPFIRTPYKDPKSVLKLLDIGATGIIYPEINTKEEAEKVVKFTKYPPHGVRGLASTRSADYGFTPKKEYIKHANKEIAVIVVLESQTALNNLDEILSVKGIDAFLIGTSDLSMSLSLNGDASHPKVLAAVDEILQMGKKLGVSIGGYLRSGQSPDEYFASGASIVMTSINSLLRKSLVDFVKKCMND